MKKLTPDKQWKAQQRKLEQRHISTAQRTVAIALIVLGSPVWLTLLFSFLAVVLAAYIVAWSLIAALYAVLLGMAVCGPCGALGLVAEIVKGNFALAVLLLGGGCALLGLALLALPWLNRATVAVARASAWCAQGILRIFERRKA